MAILSIQQKGILFEEWVNPICAKMWQVQLPDCGRTFSAISAMTRIKPCRCHFATDNSIYYIKLGNGGYILLFV